MKTHDRSWKVCVSRRVSVSQRVPAAEVTTDEGRREGTVVVQDLGGNGPDETSNLE